MREVIDIFHFNNEMEMLDLRVHILDPLVDKFIIKEALETFRGDSKECLASTYKHPKVFTCRVELPANATAWERDRHQKNAVIDLDAFDVPDDAIIMVSDVDEVPRLEVVAELVHDFNPEVIYTLEQTMYQYYLNMRDSHQRWEGTQIYSKNIFMHRDVQRLRQKAYPYALLRNAGWHWSFLGGIDEIKRKLQAYAHEEFSDDKTLRQIDARLQNGEDVLGRLRPLHLVEIDESYPEYVRRNVTTLQRRGLIKST
jgi:beta-1,4-mannosyl-glycoprotein beta-1,4-N-acetylglucosaminyltransferase